MTRSLQILRNLIKQSLIRAKVKFRFLEFRRELPVVVYQMGKVGSSTVVKTLSALDISFGVEHVHTLSLPNLQSAIQKARRAKVAIPEHLLVSGYLINELQSTTKKIRFITLTRSPVDRAISFVFEDIRKQASEALDKANNIDLLKVQQVLLNLLDGDGGVADPTQWFDQELKAEFGIDVFARPFDWDKRFQILENENASCLVLRMEDLNDVLAPALSAFLGINIRQSEMILANLGARKWYSADLKHIKNNLKLDAEVLNAILETRYVQHFYKDKQEQIRLRWLAKG